MFENNLKACINSEVKRAKLVEGREGKKGANLDLHERKVSGEILNEGDIELSDRQLMTFDRDIEAIDRVINKQRAQLIHEIADARERRRIDLEKILHNAEKGDEVKEVFVSLARALGIYTHIKGFFPSQEVQALCGSVGINLIDLEKEAQQIVGDITKKRGPGAAVLQSELSYLTGGVILTPELEADDLLRRARATAGIPAESGA